MGTCRTAARGVAAAALLAVLLLPRPAAAQTPALDSLRAQLRTLQAKLDSLRAVVAAMEGHLEPIADTGDALARIRAAAAAAAGADTTGPPAQQPQAFEGRTRNLNLLNPEISVTGDLLALARTGDGDSDTDNFVPREFELSFVSNLDPFSRAKIFVAHHIHGGELEPFVDVNAVEEEEEEHGEVEIEEGYVEWVGLGGGMSVMLGKFRQRFGRLNRWHAHALPAQQLPLPYIAFLGEEGLAQTGVGLHWLTPLRGFGTYEIWGEVTRSSAPTLFGESHGPSVLGHLNAFWQLSPATYFEIGLSGIAGDAEGELAEDNFGSRVFGVDFTLDWTPPAASRYRQATLHGGYVMNRRSFDGATDANASGAFLIGEYKFAQQWIAGARYEYTENPASPGERAWLISPSLTWWQSEFVRLRAAYELLDRPNGRFGQFVLQTTFAMGPHKHETY